MTPTPAQAMEVFREGYDTLAIAEMAGCSEAQAYNALAARGQELRRAPHAHSHHLQAVGQSQTQDVGV